MTAPFKVGDRIRVKCCTDPVCHRRATKYEVIFARPQAIAAVPMAGASPLGGGRVVYINPDNWEPDTYGTETSAG